MHMHMYMHMHMHMHMHRYMDMCMTEASGMGRNCSVILKGGNVRMGQKRKLGFAL